MIEAKKEPQGHGRTSMNALGKGVEAARQERKPRG